MKFHIQRGTINLKEMKTQLVNIVIYSTLLIIILSFYFISTVSILSIRNIGLILGILLISYFLFINVTYHFIDFKDNLKLKQKKYSNITPSLKKSIYIFFSILIIISLLTYFNTKTVQIVPIFIDREYNSLIIMGFLILLFFQEVQKRSTFKK